ncbi:MULTISPECIES: potassium/proton antiporter [unclassified Campylobacter]|uniref:potassium/proton antiporter n=1 Tax=unclassified Campylobacter TaxID=2593542 RepID=UPI001551E64A|nr:MULTISPECIES: potassium/proton antiporter [unclassified Campylobacter]QKF92095.1 potassium:proton antiporter [Campylobacter sp. CCUG 57310]
MENFLLFFAILLIASIVFSKISDKFGIPSLIVFLAVGMLAGSDGLLGIEFSNQKVAQDVGTIALIFILYAGGLDTKFKAIKPVMLNGIILATIGVALTASGVAVIVKYLLDFSWMEAFLFGAIISSTDAAAVFAILKAKEISLKNNLGPLLELESGSNDPMAIFLTMTIIQMISLATIPAPADVALVLLEQFLLGGVMGYIFGVLMPAIFNRLRLEYWGLYPVFSIAWVLLLYTLAVKVGGNGFLAVYIAGIFINKKEFAHKKNLVGFHDGIAWTMQIVVFLTLGLLVFPSALPSVALMGFVIALWIMFIARPIGVFISLMFSRYAIREKIFISWVGLRGVVPIVLATYPYGSKLPNAELIFNTIFFIVLISIVIQGTTLEFVAKKCGVEDDSEKAEDIEASNLPIFYQTLRQHTIHFGSEIIEKNLAELELPSDFLILLIKRKGEYIKPTGSSVFEEGDLLLIQCEDENKYNEILKTYFVPQN